MISDHFRPSSKKVDVVDAQPVELDPPAPEPGATPELARWTEIADRNTTIQHDGDASMVMPFLRPSWSDPEEDSVGHSVLSTCYRSTVARVAATRCVGRESDARTVWDPAMATAQVRIDGDGIASVSLGMQYFSEDTKRWKMMALTLTPEEAHKVAAMLLAAADLAVSE